MDSFGKRLKQLRLNKELTQAQLGKIFNVTNVGVAKWESDDRFPDKGMLIKLADYFDVSIDYLLCRTDNPEAKTYKANVNGDEIEVEIHKNYPHDLSPEEVELLINQLRNVGFDVDKLIEKAKKEKNM
ncbi:helix-turn-helix domain-containing protein [Clostridium paridis]|uniref:Helix-turn-helix transcriptional regulator n=1 Tax=Clostridium paridis TaxID=2803863 RepID=A0A937FIY4_9CLOT|nr:helix-turn-helix transcriptional regulator [Clostridium paridis]MBL4933022.1 helix-turn-helix transcriptional regulator [Clostridium paridis]